MPELRKARAQLAKAQRDVLARTKALHAADLALALARATRDRRKPELVAKRKAAVALASRMLKAASDLELQSSRKLAKVIASEAAKSSAETQARTLALYEEKQQQKTEADLQKALAVFSATWLKRRNKSNARKLAAVTKKAAAKVAQARKKANAKAKAAVAKATALSKARARKAAKKARTKASRLKVRV
jgi:colicin import membrane protein